MKHYYEQMAVLVETLDTAKQSDILSEWANVMGPEFDLLRCLADGTFWSVVYGPITRNGEESRLESPYFKAGVKHLRRLSPEDALEVEHGLGMV
jgi:hypothetical protein